MNLDEFKEYVRRQRRQAYDQRNPTKDDTAKQRNVGTNKQDEPIHRDLQGRTDIKI